MHAERDRPPDGILHQQLAGLGRGTILHGRHITGVQRLSCPCYAARTTAPSRQESVDLTNNVSRKPTASTSQTYLYLYWRLPRRPVPGDAVMQPPSHRSRRPASNPMPCRYTQLADIHKGLGHFVPLSSTCGAVGRFYFQAPNDVCLPRSTGHPAYLVISIRIYCLSKGGGKFPVPSIKYHIADPTWQLCSYIDI